MQQSFWDRHYQGFKLQEPSGFSRYCLDRYLQETDVVVELGCGNGRDGLALATRVGHYVGTDACSVALDNFSESAKEHSKNLKRQPTLLKADFTALDFNEFKQGSARLVVYSRFSMHSITVAEQDKLMENIGNIEGVDWLLMLEARTIYDELYGVGKNIGPHEYETDHYRRFIDPNEFLRKKPPHFHLAYFEVSKGFAAYKKEDPVVMRAVMKRKP